MKKLTKRTLCALLASLMLIPLLVSCGSDTTSVSDDTTAAGTEAITTEAVTGREAIDDELGEYDFNGYEFRIATCNNATANYVIEEETGDVVDDAKYQRNRTLEERFNFKVKVINDTGHRETEIIVNSVSAGDDMIDLVSWHVMVLGGLVTSDYFVNWYDVPNVDFDKPWWSASNKEHLSYDGYCPIAIGDLLIDTISNTYCIFYNKTIGQNYDIPDMFEVVNNGEWTIDYIANTVKNMYTDLNGDSVRDDSDFYGYVSNSQSHLNTYMWSFDNLIYTKQDDKLIFSMNMEKTADIVDKLSNLFMTNAGFRSDFKYLPGTSGTVSHGYATTMFLNKQALFTNGLISNSLGNFRDLEDDFSILPYPKWDEAQDDYITIVDGGHRVMAIPVTAQNLDMLGVIVESLCAESYKQVVPVYYDVALKVKGTRDEESVEMLDKLISSRVFDFGFIYDNWKGAGFIIQGILGAEDHNFASYWASKESSVMAHYDSMIEYFENHE